MLATSTCGQPRGRQPLGQLARWCRPGTVLLMTTTLPAAGRASLSARRSRRRPPRRRTGRRRRRSACGVPTAMKMSWAGRDRGGQVGGEAAAGLRGGCAGPARAGPARRSAACRRCSVSILRGVLVDADDVVAALGEAGAGDQPDVAGADDGDFHCDSPSDASHFYTGSRWQLHVEILGQWFAEAIGPGTGTPMRPIAKSVRNRARESEKMRQICVGRLDLRAACRRCYYCQRNFRSACSSYRCGLLPSRLDRPHFPEALSWQHGHPVRPTSVGARGF